MRVARSLLLILLAVPLPAKAVSYDVPDAELMSSQFGMLPGYSGSSSTLGGRVYVSGLGVRYSMTLAGSDSGKIGFGEPAWPLDPVAGLDPDPGVPGGCWPHPNSSLAAYSRYEMRISYISGPANSDIDVGLFLNTGLCGRSGYPNLNPSTGLATGDPTNDTWWGGAWVALTVGETGTLFLDFASAEAWNIADNKVPHTGGGLAWPNGALHAINDRDLHEISNIGFQVADFDGDALGYQVQVLLNSAEVPEPISIGLFGAAFGFLAWRERRRAIRSIPPGE